MKDKILTEIGAVVETADANGETPVAFFSVLVSRRKDGLLSPTITHLLGDATPPVGGVTLSPDYRKALADAIRRLADNIER